MRVNEQGRSMIEMLGVLAIVGVLSVGGIAGYSKAMNKFKTNKVIDQVNMMSTNIRTLYSSQRNYAKLTNGIAISMGVIPNEMYAPVSNGSYSSDYTITNAFGGATKVEATIQGTASEGSENSYAIVVESIPKTSCVSIATTDWGGDSGSGLVAMWIEGGTDKTLEGVFTSLDADLDTGDAKSEDGVYIAVPGTDYTTPATLAAASMACKDVNVIGWKFQ